MPDGAALQSSRIIPGDRVLDINGVNLDGIDLAQVNIKPELHLLKLVCWLVGQEFPVLSEAFDCNVDSWRSG